MSKYIKYLLILLIVICSCREKNPSVSYFKYVYDTKNCDSKGFSSDSCSTYFPPKLFNDTVLAIKIDDRIVTIYNLYKKEKFAKEYNLDISKLKDTFELVQDTFLLKFFSYTLFKMNEPILYDHYIKKDIYRMIAFRAFDPPLLVRIERNREEIMMTVKKLNKPIRYPFLVYAKWDDSAYFDTALEKTVVLDSLKYNKQYNENKREQDSLAKVYNVIDYHLKKDTILKISEFVWDSIQSLIDSAGFWSSKPDIALGYYQIDGSRWILEGHTKHGYQIKAIPSPNFDNTPYKNIFDDKDQYVRLFKYMLNSASLDKEPQY